MASGGQDRRVVFMLPLVVGIARLGFEHAWPVFIGRRHDSRITELEDRYQKWPTKMKTQSEKQPLLFGVN